MDNKFDRFQILKYDLRNKIHTDLFLFSLKRSYFYRISECDI